MNKQRFLGLSGIARKAGKIVIGASMLRSDIQNGKKPSLVVISSFASDNTKKRIQGACEYYGVKFTYADVPTEEFGHSLGYADVSCIGIYDDGFGKAVADSLEAV